MDILETDDGGGLGPIAIRKFGGDFSLLEKLFGRPVSTSKVVYQSGIEAFKVIDRKVDGEIKFANFQLLKNGLIVRVNQNNRIACAGLTLDRISMIKLIGVPAKFGVKKNGGKKDNNFYQGILTIHFDQEGIAKFEVMTQNFVRLRQFFSRKEFGGKLEFLIGDVQGHGFLA